MPFSLFTPAHSPLACAALSQLPSTPWGIIADDLTGATDAAAAFALAGFSAHVVLDRRAPPAKADVLVLNTNSRHDPPRVARRKVIIACRWLARHDAVVLYKKMDSTLQGNIPCEVNAIRDAAGFRTALVCPANPKQGRIIQRGCLTVRGEERGAVAEHLLRQGLEHHAHIGLPQSSRELNRALGASRFVIADARDERHLTFLASAAFRRFPQVLLAGSAALAAALAVQLAKRRRSLRSQRNPRSSLSRHHSRVSDMHSSRPALILCGTSNPVTHVQLRELLRRGLAGETKLGLQVRKAVRRWVHEGVSAIIRIPVHRRPDAQIVRALRRLGPFLEQVGCLLVTGGDTAELVVRWLKPSAIEVLGEIVPGLAVGRLLGGPAAGLTFCTKPGGFGERTALRAVLNWRVLPRP